MQAVPHVSTAMAADFWRSMVPNRQGLDRATRLKHFTQ